MSRAGSAEPKTARSTLTAISLESKVSIAFALALLSIFAPGGLRYRNARRLRLCEAHRRSSVTADNAAHQRRVDLLESLADDAIRVFQDEVNARPHRTLAAASFVPLERSVQKAANDAQSVMGEMQNEELRLLRQRNEAADSSARQSNLFILLGGLAAFMFLGAAAVSLRFDVAERRQSEAKLRGLLESAPDAMVIVDQTGRIALINR